MGPSGRSVVTLLLYDGSDITDTGNLKLCFYVIYLLPASESQRQAC